MSYLHTSKEFPWPVRDALPGEVGYGTSYPVGLSRSAIIEFVYRVRKLQMTGSVVGDVSLDYSTESDGDAHVSTSSSDTMSCSAIQVVETECLLAYDSGFLSSEESNVSHTDSNGDDPDRPVFIAVSIHGSCTLNALFGDSVLLSDGLYYPLFSPTFTVDAQASGGGVNVVKRYAHPKPDSHSEVSISCSLLGQTFDLKCGYFEEDTSSLPTGNSYTVSMTLNAPNISFEALEWWPYDPGDGGGAVWSSSSGTQLRDPYSIMMISSGVFM